MNKLQGWKPKDAFENSNLPQPQSSRENEPPKMRIRDGPQTPAILQKGFSYPSGHKGTPHYLVSFTEKILDEKLRKFFRNLYFFKPFQFCFLHSFQNLSEKIFLSMVDLQEAHLFLFRCLCTYLQLLNTYVCKFQLLYHHSCMNIGEIQVTT